MSPTPRSAVESSPSIGDLAKRNLVRGMQEPRGSYEIYFPAPHVCLSRARGHISVAFAELVPAAFEAHGSQAEPIVTFNDWEGVTSYDSEARRLLTIWTLSNARKLRTAEFLVRSRIVAMGIAAANLATKAIRLPLVSHTNRSDFEKSLARALGQTFA